MCRKIRHATSANANVARCIMQRVHADLGLTTYFCPMCKGWHVGHMRRRAQRIIGPMRMWKAIDRAVRSDLANRKQRNARAAGAA
jgi:hypothetical protein